MKRLLWVLLATVVAVPVMAGPPTQGVYYSTDIGGTVLEGRFSESWVGMGPGQIGNTLNSMSFDGATLGTEWRFYCASIAVAPVLISDTRDASNTGEVVWKTDYDGGLFWLSKDGPWGDGLNDYTGFVTLMKVTTTYHYVLGQVLGIRSNVTLSGQFDDYDDCLEYVINNTAVFGDTDNNGPLPADYPPFMDANCQTGILNEGAWGSVTEIAMQIVGSCTLPVETTTWGSVKALYGD
jgi:hypothetical protein